MLQPAEGVVRRHVRVGGVVQGVGFRPYVYRLASEERLAGRISNGTAGVTLEIEGGSDQIDRFLHSPDPELLVFDCAPEANVFPMVPAGAALSEMLLEEEPTQ